MYLSIIVRGTQIKIISEGIEARINISSTTRSPTAELSSIIDNQKIAPAIVKHILKIAEAIAVENRVTSFYVEWLSNHSPSWVIDILSNSGYAEEYYTYKYDHIIMRKKLELL